MAFSLTVLGSRKRDISSWFYIYSKMFFYFFHMSIPYVFSWSITKLIQFFYQCFWETLFGLTFIQSSPRYLVLIIEFIYRQWKRSPRQQKFTNIVVKEYRIFLICVFSKENLHGIIFQTKPKSLFHVNVLVHSIFLPSLSVVLRHILLCNLHLYILPYLL